jgi:carboxylesterase type B
MGEKFSESTSWAYRYNQRNPTSKWKGVGHAAENWMMFKGSNTGYVLCVFFPHLKIIIYYASFNGSTTFSPMTPTEDAFAAELIAYWLSFVRFGDPNKYRLSRSPEWPMYKSSSSTSRIVLQQGPGSTTTRTRTVSGSFVEEEPETAKIRCAIVASQVGRQQN